MKSKILLFVFFVLYGSVLQAQDYTWSSDDKLVSLVAVTTYDPQSHALTSITVTLSDYTVGAAATPPTTTPYIYPAPLFTFPFIPPSAVSPQQNVTPVEGKSTVNGTMEFRHLQSSNTATFLYIDLLSTHVKLI